MAVTFYAFRVTVATSGTPVQLDTFAVESDQMVLVKAPTTNAGTISIGNSSAEAIKTNAENFRLTAGQSVELKVPNTNEIWIDSTQNSDVVEVLVGGSGASSGSTSGSAGTQYTEADTDTTITGTAVMWEDTSDTLRAVSAAKPLPVSVQNNFEVVDSGGAESDSIGAAPFRRSDSFQATITSADAQAATSVKAKTASKKIYVTDLIISVGGAMNVQLQDDAGSPVVLMEQIYMPANSVFSKSFRTPLMVATNQDLDVITSAAGNISVTVTGYVI